MSVLESEPPPHRQPLRRSSAPPHATPYPHDDQSARMAHAIHGLRQRYPDYSAETGLHRSQKIAALGVCTLLCAGLIWNVVGTLILLNLGVLVYSTALILLRSIFLFLREQSSDAAEAPLESYPVYTLLVPLYDEANVVDNLIASLNALDYPRDKLDIKLILEDDDVSTRTKIARTHLDPAFEIICVPTCTPKTKPKACNYALTKARGAYVVIYDAEDRPEPDQLKQAADIFASSPPDLICLQARLNYYNPNDNWLTRQFTLEYSTWFRLVLPGLYRFGLPIPLGGTSNHFRTQALRDIGAWDAFNVTEDADLGMRIAAFGYRCGLLPSTTYEEANCRLGNWLRQRSRWQKGFLQTWLTHMRHPVDLTRRVGLWGFASLHLVIGGALFTALAPLLFVVASACFAALTFIDPHVAYPASLQLANGIIFITGYGVAILSGAIGLKRAGVLHLWPSLLTSLLYWIAITCGALKGFAQMLTKPWYWEKTEHGLSEHVLTKDQWGCERSVVSSAHHAAMFDQVYPTSHSERPQ